MGVDNKHRNVDSTGADDDDVTDAFNGDALSLVVWICHRSTTSAGSVCSPKPN